MSSWVGRFPGVKSRSRNAKYVSLSEIASNSFRMSVQSHLHETTKFQEDFVKIKAREGNKRETYTGENAE